MDHCTRPVLETYLAHHGVKGQRWGIRRYQNTDGTLTNAGKERYSDPSEESGGKTEKSASNTKKKVAIGVTTGAAIVTGTVLTAYFVKKYGAKNISDIGDTAAAGKEILQDILKTTPVSTIPISQIPTPKIEPKQAFDRVAKSAPIISSPINSIPSPRVNTTKPSSSVPPPYSFDSLMRQNDDLLKKMLAELA